MPAVGLGHYFNLLFMKGLIQTLWACTLIVSLSACSGGEELNWQALKLSDLQGEAVNLKDLKGERIFLNFWATWCRPCLAEMPEMEQLRKAVEEEGYQFILVSDEPIETIQAYTSKKPYGFNYLKLNTSIKSLGIFSIPQTFIIDREGNIVQHIAEYSEWNTPEKLALLKDVP